MAAIDADGRFDQSGRSENLPTSSRSWLARLWRVLRGSDDKLYVQSANQYLIALKSTYLALLAARTGDANKLIWDELVRIFARYPDGVRIRDDMSAWDDAFRCERLLVNLYDPTRLAVELDRRILEAQESKIDFAAFYVGRQEKPATAGDKLTEIQQEANRALLAKVIEDQQWHNTKLYLKRGYARYAQRRVTIAFLVSLAIFSFTMWTVFQTRLEVVSSSDEDGTETQEPPRAAPGVPVAPKDQ